MSNVKFKLGSSSDLLSSNNNQYEGPSTFSLWAIVSIDDKFVTVSRVGLICHSNVFTELKRESKKLTYQEAIDFGFDHTDHF